jgi:DNA-binding response OmpR family regulator
MRILCVDNDEDIRFLLEQLLALSNLEAISVKDTATALHLIETEQFSLYIIDGQAPGASGFGLCEEIRQRDKKTPIIIFSGLGYAADREAGMLAGANVYLVKPETSEIVSIAKRLLKEAHDAGSYS